MGDLFGIHNGLGYIGFRTRGNTSLQAGKKSFKIDFNNGLGTWNGLHELNLNGSHNDPSMIRAAEQAARARGAAARAG